MLDLFNRLTQKERKEFGNFLKSPFFNKNKNLIKIFDYLNKIQSIYSGNSVSEIGLFKELNINGKNKQLLRDFRILMEQFLTYKQFEKDENTKMMYELRALQEKNEIKYYRKKLNEFIKIFNNKYKRDENYYSNRISIEDDYYNFTIEKYAFDYPALLDCKRDNIIYNFYFQLLHCYNDMMIHEKYAGKNFNLKFPYLNEILEDINFNLEEIKNQHPNIYIIYLTILISQKLRQNQDTLLIEKEYKNYLENNIHKFDKSQLYHYYLYLLNYYWDLVKKGKIEYRQEIFETYKYAEEKGFIFLNNNVTPEVFASIVSSATTTDNLQWAEYFIEKYKKFLVTEDSNDFLNLTYAKVFFLKRDFQKSISSLSVVNGKSMNNYLSSKVIFCKVYYETKDINGIEFELENMRKYGERQKKIHERYKTGIKNFRKYMKALIKIEELGLSKKNDANNIAEFYVNEISNMEYFIPEKAWFLEKFSLKTK